MQLAMIGLGRTRPLYDPNLIGIIHWPIGLLPHALVLAIGLRRMAIWSCAAHLATWWQTLRHSSFISGGTLQRN